MFLVTNENMGLCLYIWLTNCIIIAHLILLLTFFPDSPFSGSGFFRIPWGVKSKENKTILVNDIKQIYPLPLFSVIMQDEPTIFTNNYIEYIVFVFTLFLSVLNRLDALKKCNQLLNYKSSIQRDFLPRGLRQNSTTIRLKAMHN